MPKMEARKKAIRKPPESARVSTTEQDAGSRATVCLGTQSGADVCTAGRSTDLTNPRTRPDTRLTGPYAPPQRPDRKLPDLDSPTPTQNSVSNPLDRGYPQIGPSRCLVDLKSEKFTGSERSEAHHAKPHAAVRFVPPRHPTQQAAPERGTPERANHRYG